MNKENPVQQRNRRRKDIFPDLTPEGVWGRMLRMNRCHAQLHSETLRPPGPRGVEADVLACIAMPYQQAARPGLPPPWRPNGPPAWPATNLPRRLPLCGTPGTPIRRNGTCRQKKHLAKKRKAGYSLQFLSSIGGMLWSIIRIMHDMPSLFLAHKTETLLPGSVAFCRLLAFSI